MPELGPAELLAGILLLSLTAYALLAGADFGGGIWDLFATGPRRAKQREVIAHAIGPIWEANHVWLILAVVLLFTCFPVAFATLAIRLHIPLSLMLIGIVLRGSAFVFRTYDAADNPRQRTWGRTFAMASVITPILLGTCVGAIASGALAGDVGGFAATYLEPWLGPFPLAVGVLALGLFAFLAATYLTLETTDRALQEDFRFRALAAGGFVFFAAWIALLLSPSEAPRMQRLLTEPLALVLQVVTAAAAITALAALWWRRYRLARLAAALQVACILWGWGLAQYPYILPYRLTIEQAAAPARTLQLVLLGLGAGTLILAPSLWYLFRVFKGKRSAFEEVG